ncbi:hypothetical protein HDU96_005506, partial [Phlyctochytrium bullatum]
PPLSFVPGAATVTAVTEGRKESETQSVTPPTQVMQSCSTQTHIGSWASTIFVSDVHHEDVTSVTSSQQRPAMIDGGCQTDITDSDFEHPETPRVSTLTSVNDSATFGSIGFKLSITPEVAPQCTHLAPTLTTYTASPPLPPAVIDKGNYAVVIDATTFEQSVQTDPVIITAVPKTLVRRDYHCVAQICARINDQLHLDVLLDTGADINVITHAALRKIKSRYGRSVQIHPFPYAKHTKGVGGFMAIDGYCVLDISPGRHSRVTKSLAFQVLKESPRPIILGMPTVNAFHMDLCTSVSELN